MKFYNMKKIVVLIGFLFFAVTSMAQKHNVKTVSYKEVTTAERDAFVVPAGEHWKIYNVTTLQFEYWDGDSWEAITGGGGVALPNRQMAYGNLTGDGITSHPNIQAYGSSGWIKLTDGTNVTNLYSNRLNTALVNDTGELFYNKIRFYDVTNGSYEILKAVSSTNNVKLYLPPLTVNDTIATVSDLAGLGASLDVLDENISTVPTATTLNFTGSAVTVTDAGGGQANINIVGGSGESTTVSDTAEIDLTLTTNDISGVLVAGSIDETKLDASVNASLDLADNSVQLSGALQTITSKKTFDTGNDQSNIVSLNADINKGIESVNSNGGQGIYSNNSNIGQGIYSLNLSTGDGIVSEGNVASSGFVYVGKNGITETFTVNKEGDVVANSFAGDGSGLTGILGDNLGNHTATQNLDLVSNDILNTGDIVFQTGVTGGTLETGTSNADKFKLMGYDVDGAAYVNVLEVDAGNDVRLQINADALELEDSVDLTKKVGVNIAGATTATQTDLIFAQTANRNVTFQDKDYTVAGLDDIVDNSITNEIQDLQSVTDTGATTTNTISTPRVNLDGTTAFIGGSLGQINIQSDSYINLIEGTTNKIAIGGSSVSIKGNGGQNALLQTDLLTTSKVFDFPDQSGVLAVTSDIPVSGVDFDPVGTNNGTDDQTATEVSIADAGLYYTGSEVETALQEVGSSLALKLETEVDGSITNEGALTVGVGTATTSLINSNTLGSTPVTLTAGTNITLSESGNVITIDAAGGGGLANIVEDVTPQLGSNLDTNTFNIDFTNGTAIRSGQALSDTALIQAYDVNGATYTTFGTLTSHNNPTFDLSTSVTVGGSPILTAEVDGSITNEIQTLSFVNPNLSISGGNSVDISAIDTVLDEATVDGYANNNGYLLSEVDGSITNEGSLTVGAGTATTSLISSNTSGSTDVTLSAGTNITLSEVGNVITIDATAGGDVSKLGTFVDNQIMVATSDGVIEGSPNFTFNDTSTRLLSIGQNDNIGSRIYLYGDSASNGGSIYFFNGALTDDINQAYEINSNIGGNFRMAATQTGDFLTYIASTESLQIPDYGTGAKTGTPTYALQVDASGNIIEGALSGGGGLNNVVEDLTPELGGNLTIGSNNLVGTSDFVIGDETAAFGNGRIVFNNGTGSGALTITGGTSLTTNAYNSTTINIDVDNNNVNESFRVLTNSVTSLFDINENGTILAPQMSTAEITTAGNTALITKEYGDANYLGGGGNVTKVGTPLNDQVGVWTGDGTIEGGNNFTFDGAALSVSGTGGVSLTTTGALSMSQSGGYQMNFSPAERKFQYGLSGTNVDLIFPDAAGAITFNLPNKTTGTYTIATLSDISGGGDDVSTFAEKTGNLVGTDRLVGLSGATDFNETISAIPLSIFNNDLDLSAKQDNITLTTTGTSGAATLIGATLNIPQYAGGGESTTVSDTAEIDLTLTGSDISGVLIAGSIDETKLDVSTNASLDLADTALQSFTEVDGSITNEGSLTVGAGTATTSVISSNTSGSTDVTLTAGTNITLSEVGNVITIDAAGGASPTFGTDNQIPFMNAGGTDFEYSSGLTYDGSTLGVTGKVTSTNGFTFNYTGTDTGLPAPFQIDAGSSALNSFPAFVINVPATGLGKAFQAQNAGETIAWASFERTAGGTGKQGIALGSGAVARDVNLYRDAPNVLKTDDAFVAVGTVTGSNLSGTNTGDQTITLTGDVTGTGTGSFATTIGAGAVDIVMLSATGTPSATTYLRGDNTWGTITGGGNVTTDNIVFREIPYGSGVDNDVTATPNFRYDEIASSLLIGVNDSANGDLELFGDAVISGGFIKLYAGELVDNDNDYIGIKSSQGDLIMEGNLTGTFFTYDSGLNSIKLPIYGGGTKTGTATYSLAVDATGKIIEEPLPDLSGKQDNITLTTNGTSGAATLIGSTLNVPQYVGSGGGDVLKIGTPLNNQIGVWTGDGTIEGAANLSYTGNALNMSNITAGGGIYLTGAVSGEVYLLPNSIQVSDGNGYTDLRADKLLFDYSAGLGGFLTFQGTPTAATRTITMPDATGTVALTSDITGTNSGTNTGDQTSIVGITGTTAQFNTAITDGNFVTKQSKSITIESPTATEDISMFFTNSAITITEMRAVVRGTTPSVTFTIRHGIDRSLVGAEVVTGGTTTTSQTTGSDIVSFNDATIVADSFVWLETTAQTGTVDEMNLTIIYTED